MKELKEFFWGIIIMVIELLLSGLIILKLWNWFITITFNIPELDLVKAMGLCLVINLFMIKLKKKDKELKEVKYLFLKKVIFLLILLFEGWIVSLFI